MHVGPPQNILCQTWQKGVESQDSAQGAGVLICLPSCALLCTHTKASRSKRMVIPLPNPPMPDGQLPEECQPNLLCLKHSILAMIFFASGRAVCAIALGAGAVSFDVTALPNMFHAKTHVRQRSD